MPIEKKLGFKRQLVIFINLEGVDYKKTDLFFKFSQTRAQRLNVQYSALNIFMNEKDELHHQDVLTIENAALYPENPSMTPGQIQILHAKSKIFTDFKKKSIPVKEQYDYILVIGEMNRSSSDHSISKIKQLNDLVFKLKSTISEYANKNIDLRVQICFSGKTFVSPGQIFSTSLIPDGCNVHLSAPDNWSIIGRNGAAIDFKLIDDNRFSTWAPFLNSMILNNFNLKQIKINYHNLEKFSNKKQLEWKKLIEYKKIHPSVNIESLNIALFYPSQNQYERIFENMELRISTPVIRRTPLYFSRSPVSFSPVFFRTITPVYCDTSSSASVSAATLPSPSPFSLEYS